jgi:subtilisin family serine protease
MMIANNILKVAPKAKLFDLPVVPPFQIPNIQTFLSTANAAYITMLFDVALMKLGGQNPGPWILVNPWGIFSRKTEIPLGHYTQNPQSPFNIDVAGAVLIQGIDVLFAAGNCGQFCPDRRCGGRDRGPSRSIWGANSLKEVLTVGAVRADDMWLGYSSQGPGQQPLGGAKPDFCATSQFSEDDDGFNINTGTSAATGLTAGIVAALRSRWNSAIVSPYHLQQILNQTARKPTSVPWTGIMRHRLGHGILDARAAYDQLLSKYP